jgi:DNA processing protein
MERMFDWGSTMDEPMREQAAVLALVRASPGEWYQTADVIAEAGSALRLFGGEPMIMSTERRRHASELTSRVKPANVSEAQALIDRVTAQGVRLITIVDEDYPEHLKLIFNRPPFLWVRGQLESRKLRAIAVVGTRQATEEGRAAAAGLARGLASAGVTVLSGLARGIDTAAHTATLEAGGTTVAVVGTGILAPVYPPENGDLARRIVDSQGAVVSQFWPEAPPRKANFPRRNVVMSGMAAGTVVVEAGKTSGAKMQARLALEHGKRLFLPEALVAREEWASAYATRPAVTVVSDLNDILDELVKVVEIPHQLSLNF